MLNIGVRKCGTTSVYDWLAAHPEVCATIPKGTEFLLDRNSPYWNADSNYANDGLEGYEKHFRSWAGEPVVFEGATRYFEEEQPCAVLSNLEPQPFVFAVLREPADRAFSAFRYMQNNEHRIDRRLTFSRFVEFIEDEKTDELISFNERTLPDHERNKFQAEMASVISCGQYADHLRSWREAFEPGNLKLYLFEDLKSNPRSFMEQLADDIGIDPSYYGEFRFKVSNPTVRGCSAGVEHVVQRLKPFLPKTPCTRALRRWHRDRRRPPFGSPDPADEATLIRLKNFYRPFNERLAAEFQLDLSVWNEQ